MPLIVSESVLQFSPPDSVRNTKFLYVRFRWKRIGTEEDISKMGELAPDSDELPNPGPLYRSSRWQDAHETFGNSVWGKTGRK